MTRLQIRRGTTTQWTNGNPILAAGEPGLDITTGIMKVGDGITNWNSLLAEWAPASLLSSAPRGVIASGIGTAFDPSTISAVSTVQLTNGLTYTFEATRRYRIWFTIRALTAGGVRMGVSSSSTPFNTDQYFSSDRSYDGGAVNWFINGGMSGVQNIRVFSYSGTAGALLYGKDFYIEDVGGA